MPADTDHARIVERLGDTHEARLVAVMRTLEDRIADAVISAPVSDGRLFDLEYAIQARTAIQQAVQEEYIATADAIIREYDEVVESLGTMYNEYSDFTGVSPQVIAQLKTISFQGFEDIASTFVDEMANELYQNTLAGRPVSESVKAIRQKVNGVYIQSDEAEINRLVSIAQGTGEAAEEAARELRRVYASDRLGRNMRRYASQQVHDSIMQFDSGVNMAVAREIGADKFKYYGSVIRDSREWCQRHAGKVYTEDEIRSLWADNDWAGKAPGDPFIVRGGYNCRHHFRVAFDD